MFPISDSMRVNACRYQLFMLFETVIVLALILQLFQAQEKK